jgi:ribulose 1,5-bisphosphate carboxylase large subunit-like protein
MLFSSLSKVVVIYKVLARVIRWVNVDHLHTPGVCLLQKLERIKVVRLDEDVSRTVFCTINLLSGH